MRRNYVDLWVELSWIFLFLCSRGFHRSVEVWIIQNSFVIFYSAWDLQMECWILCVFKVCPILFLKSLWSLLVAKRRNQGQISAMQASGAENLRDFSDYLFLSSLCLKTPPPPNLVATKVAAPRDGLGTNGFELCGVVKCLPGWSVYSTLLIGISYH